MKKGIDTFFLDIAHHNLLYIIPRQRLPFFHQRNEPIRHFFFWKKKVVLDKLFNLILKKKLLNLERYLKYADLDLNQTEKKAFHNTTTLENLFVSKVLRFTHNHIRFYGSREILI